MDFDAKLKAGIQAALEKSACRYTDRQGNTWLANRLEDVKREMRDSGWRNVSRLDEIDCRSAGFKFTEAYYAARARKVERYCSVMVWCSLEDYLAQKEAQA